MRTVLWMVVVLAFAHTSVMAEGIPTKDKLSRLGLSAMNVQSDDAGHQVRGKAFGAFTLTFTLTATNPTTGNTATATGTQSFVFGQNPKPLLAVSFGGTGFGGFNDNTAPDFSTFTSTPITTDTTVTGNVAVSSIQGFMWALGR